MSEPRGLISAIIIFYNAHKFIAAAIESVLAQDFNRWELLLVDDGSSDASSDLAIEYSRRYPGRIRYCEHPGHVNKGMSASRNLGIAHARGQYVAFLDADDEWLPHKLADQLRIAEAHPDAGLICGATEYWREGDGSVDPPAVVLIGVPGDRLWIPPALSLALYPLGSGATPCPSDLFIRRDVCERVGGFEDHFRGVLQLYEDQAFLSKVYLAAPVFVSTTVWDRYRLHADSCMATVNRSGRYHEVREYFLRWFELYLRERNQAFPQVLRATRRALWPYRHPHLARVLRRLRGLRLSTEVLLKPRENPPNR
jgi:glycosyltransferase involved in cell wall biosynthesis